LDAGQIFQVDFSRYAHVQTAGRPAAWPAALFTTKGDRLRPVAIEAPGFTSALVFAPEFDRSVNGADWVRAGRRRGSRCSANAVSGAKEEKFRAGFSASH
jgi:hypothetical protein